MFLIIKKGFCYILSLRKIDFIVDNRSPGFLEVFNLLNEFTSIFARNSLCKWPQVIIYRQSFQQLLLRVHTCSTFREQPSFLLRWLIIRCPFNECWLILDLIANHYITWFFRFCNCQILTLLDNWGAGLLLLLLEVDLMRIRSRPTSDCLSVL
jgi:hypothetical protein